MIAGSSTPPAEIQKSRKSDKGEERFEDPLDEDLADTFPASDTPARISKGTISNPKPQEKTARSERIRQEGRPPYKR